MTTDDELVERLRSLADCDARAGEPLGKCMREAADRISLLREALERLHRNFHLLLAGKPVRDVAETDAEVRQALASSGGGG